jgi:hypothetical protein
MITKQELLDETYGTVEPLKELKSGLLVYNKPHFKKNFIDITADINEIKRKLRQGWEIRPGKYKFILRAPEVILCDLSEAYTNPTLNLKEILTLSRVLNSLNISQLLNKIISQHFPTLEIVLLEGKHSNFEIRAAASDRRVYKLPKILYRMLKESNLWKKEIKRTRNILRNRKLKIKIKEINGCSPKTQNFYGKLQKEYSIFEKINLSNTAVYGFWGSVPKNDVYIFVPKAGIKYALGFIEEIGKSQQIMLWECHLSLDITKELKIFNKKLKNKKVAIIDRSYSSNTLDYLGKKVAKEEGQLLKIALFPKSKRAIQRSDYILFLDKLIPSKNIQFKENWAEDLFVKIVNDEAIF